MATVNQAWNQLVHGSPSFVWEHKLMQTKNVLKKWLRVPLPSPLLSRKDRVDKLIAIQIGMENCDISLSQIALEREAQFLTTQSFRLEEDHLRLKSQSI